MPPKKRQRGYQNQCLSKTELDYSNDLPIQTSIEKTFYQDVSSEPFTGNSPIEFNISGSSQEYIDFANTYLILELSVKCANGDKLGTTEATGKSLSMVNNILHSLFANVKLQFWIVLLLQRHFVFQVQVRGKLKSSNN